MKLGKWLFLWKKEKVISMCYRVILYNDYKMFFFVFVCWLYGLKKKKILSYLRLYLKKVIVIRNF